MPRRKSHVQAQLAAVIVGADDRLPAKPQVFSSCFSLDVQVCDGLMMTGFADHLSATAVGTVPIRARFDHRSRRFRLPCLCRAQLARSCRSTKFPRGFHCPNNIFLQLRFRFQRLLSRQLGLKPKSPFRAIFLCGRHLLRPSGLNL
jgi:hypothetical protein